MVVELDQPGAAQPVSLLGAPVGLSRTPADTNRLPGPQLGEHTEAVLRAAGFDAARIAQLVADGAVAGPPDEAEGPAGSFLA
jgi:crotonobetainyl-CoA:carnitine CoA-transferase CaiB-like acyl-CoA transferase